MEKRPLGQTGLMVSSIGLGGIPFQRIDAEGTRDILARALELGINFIDTARGYTVSEQYIGHGLKQLGRERFIVATKSMKRDRQGILEELAISLSELDTDYIDLYQFHNVANFSEYETLMSPEGGYQAIREKQAEGVIRHIGISTHSVDLLTRFVADGHFSTIQFPYNPMERQAEEVFRQAHEKNIGIIVMKPFAGGAIMNKELSLRTILENDAVSVVIPGVDSIEQVEQNIAIASPLIPLSDDERSIMQSEADELGSHFCRRCRYCLPCAVEIDIPMIFLMEGYYTRYHLTEWVDERYAGFAKKAKDCIECGICESRCPYHLPIREMMKRASAVLD
ncbi:MAG: aldo/keto reductase [Tissierellia bacterium]|nr:aldo/keto reductase [Tissierellia bacterium]